MGLDLKADMHVRERRTGGRGMVLRFWRHHNGHVWAEVRFINGDTLTVRSTNLERVSLSDDEVEALSKFEALPADPLELLQRTIDRSVRVTADDGVELTNEFDEVLQADGTALTSEDLSVNRRGDGRVVPEGGIDEEAALEASTRARAGRATTRTRQLVCRACDDDPASAVVTCDICVRRARGSRAEWRVSLNSNGVLDNGVLHKMRSHCGQFASVRHASTLEHCVALGRLSGRVFSTRAATTGKGAARDARGSALAARGPRGKRPAARAAGAAPEKRPRASLAKKDDGPRLQIFDVNTGRYVDVKKDAGRGIRYHRLRHRLRGILEAHGAAAAPAVDASDPEPAPKSTADKCFELAALLLEGGFVGKLPVARAADVRALSDARRALEARPDLEDVVLRDDEPDPEEPAAAAAAAAARAAAADVTASRRRERMALLLVAHQLWTPSRTRRFVGGVAPDADDDARRDREGAEAASRDAMDVEAFCAADAAGRALDGANVGAWRAALEAGGFEPGLRVEGPSTREPAPPPRKLGAEAPSASAARCRRAVASARLSGALGPQREAAMENDVFTGRHRTRTTPDAVLDAGWTRHWDVVTDVAGAFAKAFAAATDGFVDDGVCEALLKEARRLPDVGAYIGAHLVRSLLAVFDLKIPLVEWGAFTMSDDSVGQMVKLLGDDARTPVALLAALRKRLDPARAPFFFEGGAGGDGGAAAAPAAAGRCDAGALALLLCEVHSCWALITRHSVHHAQWAFERVVATLRDTPAGWADAVREVLLDEYHQPFDDAVVYHPAHKLVLISMVAKGLHDVNVLKLPPPSTYAARPDFRVLAPGDDDAPARSDASESPPPPRQVEYMAPYGRGELAVPVDRGDCAPDGPDVAEAASALLAAVDVLPPLPPIPRVEPTTTYQHYVRDLDVDADVDDAPPLAAAG